MSINISAYSGLQGRCIMEKSMLGILYDCLFSVSIEDSWCWSNISMISRRMNIFSCVNQWCGILCTLSDICNSITLQFPAVLHMKALCYRQYIIISIYQGWHALMDSEIHVFLIALSSKAKWGCNFMAPMFIIGKPETRSLHRSETDSTLLHLKCASCIDEIVQCQTPQLQFEQIYCWDGY